MEGSREILETVDGRLRQISMGRDEMNLAEFPLATLADRAPRGCKTLVFEDQIWDRGQAQQVTRRLTISASDRYGLPTALDDEVILGLVQLSKAKEFASRCVPFSRYQLVRLLGWRDEGRSYRRLEESLKRWLGVTLYYENAWWDKHRKRWVDAHFHLLDNLVIGRRSKRPAKPARMKEPAPESSFTWNEVVFHSFQAGYLKKLDLDFYRTLNSAAAKRIYRFLDKRFHFSSQWRHSLKRFACEHVGLSRNYDASQLKRRLNPAIKELEDAGYLKPLPTEERYCRVGRGEWEVFFIRSAKSSARKTIRAYNSDLEAQLIERGVTATSATRLARKYPACRIEAKIRIFDQLVGTRDIRVSRNPAGFLVQSIREDYMPPTVQDRGRVRSHGRVPIVSTAIQTEAKHCSKPSERSSGRMEQEAIESHLAQLTPNELASLEAEAMKNAPAFLAKAYARAKTSASKTLTDEYRRCVLEHHLRSVFGFRRHPNVN